ncbi:MAG: response regulator transcription factor [Oscillospiraceae bacterium]|nr:response regulator transcription factor [Oscillospiraceae bacterium]
MKRILVLEDEDSIRSFVVINLRRAGFEPVEASTGAMALEKIKEYPDIGVALLDVMLPDIDGFEVCRRIRAADSKIGIIMLTAKSLEMDKLTGLSSGADDYVTKPFSTAELTARIDALYRRISASAEEAEEDELRQGPFVLNTRNRVLTKSGERVKLTQIEYSLMKLFMSNAGKALSRSEILTEVWGKDSDAEEKVVDVNVRRLRIKIEEDPTMPIYLSTVWGFGYQWNA